MPPILIYRNDVSERESHGQTVIIVQEGGRLVQTLYLLIDVTPLRHNPSSPKLPALPGHPRQGLFASGGLPVPHILTYRKDDSEREIHGYTLILRGGTRELLPVQVLVALCLLLLAAPLQRWSPGLWCHVAILGGGVDLGRCPFVWGGGPRCSLVQEGGQRVQTI